MVRFPIALTDDEQRIVTAEREAHPEAHVRRKMLVLWLLHCQVTRAQAATIAGLGRATVQRYVAAYRDGGLDGLRQWDVTGPVSDLTAYTDAIVCFETEIPSTVSSGECWLRSSAVVSVSPFTMPRWMARGTAAARTGARFSSA